MVRLLHVTVFEGVGVAAHKEPYACAELLDVTGRPIKKERAKTSVSFNVHPRAYLILSISSFFGRRFLLTPRAGRKEESAWDCTFCFKVV